MVNRLIINYIPVEFDPLRAFIVLGLCRKSLQLFTKGNTWLFVLQPVLVAKIVAQLYLRLYPPIWVVMATGQMSNEQRLFCAEIVFILMVSPY